MFTGNYEKCPSYKSRIRDQAADLCKEGIDKIISEVHLKEGEYDDASYREELVSDILDVIRSLSDYI